MPNTHRPYAPEFRQQMVELVRSGRTPEQLAQEYEPSTGAIRNWVAQRERDAGQREDGLSSDEREDLRRLRWENKQLRIERDIQKKQRPGSHGRATRSRSGVRVREGRVAGAYDMPITGSLRQRLLRLDAPQTVSARAPGWTVAGADQGDLE